MKLALVEEQERHTPQRDSEHLRSWPSLVLAVDVFPTIGAVFFLSQEKEVIRK